MEDRDRWNLINTKQLNGGFGDTKPCLVDEPLHGEGTVEEADQWRLEETSTSSP